MYIEVKKQKTKYQLYLVHSKRIDGKSTKIINQYLCSIVKKYIEGADDESFADVLNDIRDTMNQNIAKIQPHICIELKEEFGKLDKLLWNKLSELRTINSDEEV
jgi:hypothetical protein